MREQVKAVSVETTQGIGCNKKRDGELLLSFQERFVLGGRHHSRLKCLWKGSLEKAKAYDSGGKGEKHMGRFLEESVKGDGIYFI